MSNIQNKKGFEGAGDVVAALTKMTGINKMAKFVAKSAGKKDCGCDRRRQALNKVLPFKK